MWSVVRPFVIIM